MANIVKYQWYVDGVPFSNLSNPQRLFGPGIYDIRVDLVFDDDTSQTLEEFSFIIVSEDQQNQFNTLYKENKKSYHYGINPSTALGWSRNSGDNWVWPESQAAVTKEVVNGIEYLLVWDMFDDKQYCINPHGRDVIHLDKDDNEIACSATFAGVTGESRDYEIMHQETTIHLRKDLDSGTRPTGMSTYVSLIGEEGEVLEKVKVQTGSEIVFKEQSTYTGGEHKLLQLKFETDKSGYLMTSYESIYKTNDQSNTSFNGNDSATDALVGNLSLWLSRKKEYTMDLATGTTYTIDVNYTTGADGNANTAIQTLSAIQLDSPAVSNGTIMFWYKGSKPDLGVTTTDSVVKNGFTLTSFVGSIPADILIPDSAEIFDLRIVASELTQDQIDDYGNNLEKILGVF